MSSERREVGQARKRETGNWNRCKEENRMSFSDVALSRDSPFWASDSPSESGKVGSLDDFISYGSGMIPCPVGL